MGCSIPGFEINVEFQATQKETISDLVNRFAVRNGHGTPVPEKTASGDD